MNTLIKHWSGNIQQAIKSPTVEAFENIKKNQIEWDFPGGTVNRNPPVHEGDTHLIPGLGRTHMPKSN